MSEIQPAAETDAVAFAESDVIVDEARRQLKAAASGNSRLYRELRFKVRQLSKTCGKQGDTIYRLRAELAEVRALNSKIERGELRRLERVTQEQLDEINNLEQKLAANGQLDGGTPEEAAGA